MKKIYDKEGNEIINKAAVLRIPLIKHECITDQETVQLAHRRRYPAEPVFDEDGNLYGLRLNWEQRAAFIEGMDALEKMAEPYDKVLTNLIWELGDNTYYTEIGILRAN